MHAGLHNRGCRILVGNLQMGLWRVVSSQDAMAALNVTRTCTCMRTTVNSQPRCHSGSAWYSVTASDSPAWML
jgi:hypothetical protein